MGETTRPRPRLRPLAAALVLGCCSEHAEAFFERGGVTGMGARALGMGGAFSAVSDENSAVYWNPGGLGQLTRAELSGMYAAIFDNNVFYTFTSASFPMSDIGMMGLSWQRQDFRISPGQEKEDTFYLTLASAMTESRTFFAGVNLKYLRASSIYPNVGGTSNPIGLDWGILYRLPLPKYGKELRFGASVQDLNTQLNEPGSAGKGVTEDVPSVIRLGTAYQFERWITLAMDMEHVRDPSLAVSTSNRMRAGVEGWFFDGTLGMRLGYVGFATVPGRYSFGTSYRAPDWQVDYAFLPHSGGLGNSHRASFSLRFGRVVAAGVRPTSPLGFKATAKDGEVELVWTPSPEPTVGAYNIYVSTAPGGEYRKVNTVGLSSARVIGLENGRSYYFVVSALSNTQPPMESDHSVEIPATPMAPEMKATELVQQLTEGEITVSWKATPGDLAGYNVYVSSTPGYGHVRYNAQPLASTSVRMVQINSQAVEAGQRYYIYIRTVSRSTPPVEGPPSAEATYIAVPRQ